MYVAIEGVIGVGKTTLARLLQNAFNAEILLEVFEENPFLSDFYADRERYAFQTQIFFLLSRYQQQHEAIPAVLAQQNRPVRPGCRAIRADESRRKRVAVVPAWPEDLGDRAIG